MSLTLLTPSQSLNKAYRKEKVGRAEIELFKKNLKEFITSIDRKESEEHVKNNVTKFLYDTYYNGKNQINTKGRIDLAIYEDKKPVVIIEAKRPSSSDMVTVKNLNAKAMQELILYYLRERIDEGNIDIKYLVATNMHEWFVFDANVFDKIFYKNNALTKDYVDWKGKRKANDTTDFFYSDIAAPLLKNLKEEISFTWFDLRDVEKVITNDDLKDDKLLKPLYQLLSPAHLLKQPFANDSNSLDTKFYSELLHIIGLEEKKDGGKKLIQRKEKPDAGSLLENAINTLIAEDRLRELPREGADYGEKKDERLFNVALELCITWINRILFLKLLEGQLLNYHGDKRYRFLDFKTIPNYDELNKLFFQVLARTHKERTGTTREKFQHVPYLNSSLFEISSLEADALRINSLDDGQKLKIAGSTVLKTENGKKREGEIPTLQYLFEFLDSYDFTSEGKEEIQEENKSLINASVLGLIFEKINGYKDGSFFTPGFITMYMCRETIRRAVVQKFKEAKGWELETFDQLHNQITSKDIDKANEIINSLKICDPAVGSGHFLVSALNEILAIKSELGVLADRNGKVLRDYSVEVINDELIVSLGQNEFFEYKPGNKESQRVQEALFHEKQTIIENCLFGVDINPNSVKICRLRLWIELLKNAYYTADSKYAELETLPNIDINIKQGNSLISRFALDADLSKALKSIKYSIDDYRAFVNNYKNATDKDEKRGFEKLIDQIKYDFRTEIDKNDPKVLRKNKLGGELYNLLNQAKVFEPTEKEKKETEKKKEKLETEINKLGAEIKEIKDSAIYKDAFEWRFEFPEVLDGEGSFKGFDAVIGNPPYVFARENFDILIKNYFYENYKGIDYQINLFVLFIERSLYLLTKGGNYSLIVPNSLLMVSSTKKIRELVLRESSINEIVNFIGVSFEGVNVETVTFIGNKGEQRPSIKISIAENNEIRYSHSKESKAILESIDFSLNVFSDNESDELLKKLKVGSVELDELAEIKAGLQAYEVGKGNPKQSREDVSKRIYDYDYKYDDRTYPYIEGKDVHRYLIGPNSSFLRYGDILAAPRTFNIFSEPKIIVREITGKHPHSLICGYSDEVVLFNRSNIAINAKMGNRIYLKYILAILNSRLMSYYFKMNTAKAVRQMFPKIILEDLRKFPIKAIAVEKQEKFILLVDQILKRKKEGVDVDTTVVENKIDKLVYQLYGLSDDEIKIVEAK